MLAGVVNSCARMWQRGLKCRWSLLAPAANWVRSPQTPQANPANPLEQAWQAGAQMHRQRVQAGAGVRR
jgi:hypothetical protein